MKILKIQVKKQKMQLLPLNQLKRKLKRPLQPLRLQRQKLQKHQNLQKQKLLQPPQHQLKKLPPLKKHQLLRRKFKPKLMLKTVTVGLTTLILTLIQIHLTPTVIDHYNKFYNI